MSELLSSTGMVTVVRCSALSSYVDCERRGAARLFEREIRAANYALRQVGRGIGSVQGTSLHDATEYGYREKAASGVLPPVNVLVDKGVDRLFDEINRGGEIVWDARLTQTKNQAVHQVAKMVRSYHGTIAQKTNPIRVEEPLQADVGPGLILSGQSDLVAREPNMIRDLKSGTRTPRSFAPQLGGYALLNRSHGLDIERAAIDFVQRVAVDKPQPPPVTTTVELAHAETAAVAILHHIAAGIDAFRHGDEKRHLLPGDPWAFTANPASVLCSPKYCPAYGTEFCHEGDPARAKE